MIYFIRDAATGFVKVGHSVDPAKRLITLQIGSASALTLEMTLPGGKSVEAVFHARLATKRQRGEWFALTRDDVTAMRPAPRTVDGIPVAIGVIEGRAVVVQCPYCLEAHRHGWPGDEALAHRVEHCVDKHPGARGYYIEAA